jgi:hypothetical protein
VKTLLRIQILERIAGKTSVECLALFRHLMVDVFVASSYGYRVGALGRWAGGVEDVLCTAIHDFPIRGIIVSTIVLAATMSVHKLPIAKYPSPLGLEPRL